MSIVEIGQARLVEGQARLGEGQMLLGVAFASGTVYLENRRLQTKQESEKIRLREREELEKIRLQEKVESENRLLEMEKRTDVKMKRTNLNMQIMFAITTAVSIAAYLKP